MSSLKKYLTPGFEQDLFDAAMQNLNDTANQLYVNNFAYAMRELTRHFLARLAPDDDVMNAWWFVPYDPSRKNAISRDDRIRYAILGCLDVEYARKQMGFDYADVSRQLRKSIDELSKYTHVNPGTFNVDENTAYNLSNNILDDTLKLFESIVDAKKRVEQAVEEAIDEEMIDKFYLETFSEIDALSTHHEVLGYIVTNQRIVSRTDSEIAYAVDGIVSVRLQYGSDGDMRRGDGYETGMRFPFSSEFTANYKNESGIIHLTSSSIDVDTTSFYE